MTTAQKPRFRIFKTKEKAVNHVGDLAIDTQKSYCIWSVGKGYLVVPYDFDPRKNPPASVPIPEKLHTVPSSGKPIKYTHPEPDNYVTPRKTQLSVTAIKTKGETMNDNPETMTFEEHAIAWWAEKGYDIPNLDSVEWEIMYEGWVEYAFETFER